MDTAGLDDVAAKQQLWRAGEAHPVLGRPEREHPEQREDLEAVIVISRLELQLRECRTGGVDLGGGLGGFFVDSSEAGDEHVLIDLVALAERGGETTAPVRLREW